MLCRTVEQIFIKLSISKKHLLLIGGVYIPPAAPIELYTAHAETVDELWQSSGCNMELYVVNSIYQMLIGIIVFRDCHYRVPLIIMSRQ